MSASATLDAVLVARSLAGDRDAFAALFDRHAPRVYALARHLVGDPVEAEDIAQNAFLQALCALPTLRRPEAFGAWIARITTNLAFGAGRMKMRLPQAELTDALVETYPDASRWVAPEAMVLAAEEQHAVQLALDRLAPSHRAALTMREIGGLHYTEIAAALGTKPGGVEMLLTRARARFRHEYQKVMLGATRAPARACAGMRGSLDALVNSELTGTQQATVLAHVGGCQKCAAALETQRQTRRLLAAMPLGVPAAFKAATLTKAGLLLTSCAGTGAANALVIGGALEVTGATGAVTGGSMVAAGA